MGKWTDEFFDELAQQGDPVADAVIAAHAATVPGAAPRELVVNIAHHLVLPPEQRSAPIQDYLETVDPLPPWVDHTKLRRSQDFFDENGLVIGTALFCAALPEAYSGAR